MKTVKLHQPEVPRSTSNDTKLKGLIPNSPSQSDRNTKSRSPLKSNNLKTSKITSPVSKNISKSPPSKPVLKIDLRKLKVNLSEYLVMFSFLFKTEFTLIRFQQK